MTTSLREEVERKVKGNVLRPVAYAISRYKDQVNSGEYEVPPLDERLALSEDVIQQGYERVASIIQQEADKQKLELLDRIERKILAETAILSSSLAVGIRDIKDVVKAERNKLQGESDD